MHRILHILFAAALLIAPKLSAHTFDGVDPASLPAHPRLIMKAGDEQLIREKLADPQRDYLKVVHGLIMKEARKTLKLPCQERTDTYGHILARVRNVEKRVLCLAYAYRMTGEERWARRAEEEIVNACGYRDWDPAHYLDTAEMMIALSLGYDWLYDYLSDEVKNMIVEALLDKGLRTAKDHDFYRAVHNWNQVCNAAMVITCLAIYDRIPDEANLLIQKSLDSNPRAMASYAPDGAYPEGNTYWGYGTSYQILMIEALRTALGCDFGIQHADGFLETGNFVKYLATPAGRCFSYYDSTTKQIAHLMTFWFANEVGDPSLCHLEKAMLRAGAVKETDRWWPCAMGIMSRVEEETADFEPKHIMYAGGINPVWIYRSGWDSPEDTYLAVKGGNPCNNHGHVDNGSFFYEKGGVLWAADLGSQSYGISNKYGISLGDRSQNGQRWSVYRNGPLAHNILILDGGNPVVNAFAGISSHWNDAEGKGCMVDLDSSYSLYVSHASRRVSLNADDSVMTVSDTLVAGASKVDVVWNMMTFTEPQIINANEIVLRAEGKAMKMTLHTDAKAEAFILPGNSDKPSDVRNEGASRVGFNLAIEQGQTLTLAVTFEECSSDSTI